MTSQLRVVKSRCFRADSDPCKLSGSCRISLMKILNVPLEVVNYMLLLSDTPHILAGRLAQTCRRFAEYFRNKNSERFWHACLSRVFPRTAFTNISLSEAKGVIIRKVQAAARARRCLLKPLQQEVQPKSKRHRHVGSLGMYTAIYLHTLHCMHGLTRV